MPAATKKKPARRRRAHDRRPARPRLVTPDRRHGTRPVRAPREVWIEYTDPGEEGWRVLGLTPTTHADFCESLIDAARRLERARYYRHIRAIAEEIAARHPDARDFIDDDAIHTDVDQAADGDHYVIYTAEAMRVPLLSDAEPDGLDDRPLDPGDPMFWSTIAYAHVREDIAATVQEIIGERPRED